MLLVLKGQMYYELENANADCRLPRKRIFEINN